MLCYRCLTLVLPAHVSASGAQRAGVQYPHPTPSRRALEPAPSNDHVATPDMLAGPVSPAASRLAHALDT